MPSAPSQQHPHAEPETTAFRAGGEPSAAGRTTLRIGAVAGVGGGILTLAGNMFHPRAPGQLEDVETFLEVAAGSNLWVADHFVILIAVSLLLVAFHGLGHSFTMEPAAAWGRLARTVATVGALFALALMIIEATAVAAVADQWAGTSGVERDVSLAAGITLLELSLALAVGAILFLFGGTPLLFGVAMLASHEYPGWMGGAAILFGSIGVAAGAIQVLTGESTLTQLVLFPVAAIGTTFWIISVGIVLWRRSSHLGAGT